MTLLLELKALVAVLFTVSCVMSAVVALRVLATATVTSLSKLMPSAKLASSAPSPCGPLRLLTVRSAVEERHRGDPAVDGADLGLQGCSDGR